MKIVLILYHPHKITHISSFHGGLEPLQILTVLRYAPSNLT